MTDETDKQLETISMLGVICTLVALFFLVLMGGCASEKLVQVKVPVYVAPSCEVPNSFEKCKRVCLDQGKRPTDSWEDGKKFECNCVDFDA